MEKVQPIKVIDDFLSEKTSLPKHMIQEESFLQTINNNILWLSQIQLSPQSYFLKLNHISSILKKHNLEHIHVNLNFKSTHLGVLEEQSSFDFYCESFYKENPQYKKFIEETTKNYLEEQQILQNNKNNFSEDANFSLSTDRFSSIFHQKEKLKDLFIQFFEIVQDFKDAINLTSISIFELEILSLKKQTYELYYNEYYSKDNPLDKWFAAIHIQNFYKKPQFFVETNKMQ